MDEFWPLRDPIRLRFSDGGAATGLPDVATGHVWSEWAESEGASPVAVFAEGPLSGRPAITRHAYGKGVAWYLTTRPEPSAMRAVLDRARAEAGAGPVLPGLPDAVQAVVRRGADQAYLVLLNHGAHDVRVPLPSPAPDLLADPSRPVGAVDLAPRGVAVLRFPAEGI